MERRYDDSEVREHLRNAYIGLSMLMKGFEEDDNERAHTFVVGCTACLSAYVYTLFDEVWLADGEKDIAYSQDIVESGLQKFGHAIVALEAPLDAEDQELRLFLGGLSMAISSYFEYYHEDREELLELLKSQAEEDFDA